MRLCLLFAQIAFFCARMPGTADARDECKHSSTSKKCWPPEDDVDECALNPRICGDESAICTNRRRGFLCECPDGFIPSPSINWRVNVTFCKGRFRLTVKKNIAQIFKMQLCFFKKLTKGDGLKGIQN